jgi:hypothetical protein
MRGADPMSGVADDIDFTRRGRSNSRRFRTCGPFLLDLDKEALTYLSRLVPLALLAPDITETILEGRQPVDLSTERLFSLMPLPLSWVEQRYVLGFSAR